MLLYAGALDQAFGTHGIALGPTFASPGTPEGKAMAIQADGKILVAGDIFSGTTQRDFALERFNADGSLDTSFGTGGTVQTDLAFGGAPGSNEFARCMALQPDGKILVAGETQSADLLHTASAIVRYNADGTLDSTFSGGIVFNDFSDIAPTGDLEINGITLQPDGKIVVAGDFFRRLTTSERDFALARYNPDGTLDTSFGIQLHIGLFTLGTGEVLTSFNNGSATPDAEARAVAIQSDGRIVAVGSAAEAGVSGLALARYYADGTLDPDFQGGGKVVTPGSAEGTDVAIQADGKIVVAAGLLQLERYNPDGSLDNGFGVVDTFPFSVSVGGHGLALQGDGKIVVAGEAGLAGEVDIGLARYNSNGTLDKSFSFDGLVTTNPGFMISQVGGVAIQPDGKIVAAGDVAPNSGGATNFFVTRYLGDAGRLTLATSTSIVPESGIHTGYLPIGTGNTAVLTVNRTGGATGTVTVDYSTTDGTASAGADYTTTSGTLTFLDGETSKTISIPILDDGTLEGGSETFYVTLSNPTGEATLGAITTTVVTIKDDDIIGTRITATEGVPFTGVVASFASSNPSVPAGDYSATIDWGDGTPDVPDTTPGAITPISGGGFNVTGTHTYTEEGTYPLAVHIGGASSIGAANLSAVTVQDAPLTATAVNFSVTGHKNFSGVVANFTDVDPGGIASDYTATITWDDGTTSAGTISGSGLFSVSGSHVFAAFMGIHGVTVTIFDHDAPVSVTDKVKDPLAPSVMWGSWSPAVNWTDVHTGDFDGDGTADVIGRDPATGQWWVALSTGSGFRTSMWGAWSPAVTWVDVQVGDFNGDGKADIVGRDSASGNWWVSMSTGSSFTNSLWTTWSTTVHWVDVRVGDFTGDGKADIVGRAKETGQWWVAQSTGSSFTNSLWATWSPAATWVDVNVGDFNGDGKADITGRDLHSGSWWTAISTGSSFTTSLWATWNPAATWVDVQVGDFNGDGKADITGRYLEGGGWWTAISTGSSFTTSLWAVWSTGVTWVDVKVGDFTGDGKADIVGRAKETGQWWVAQSSGSSFTNSLWATWSTGVTWADVQIGDFEGDGTAQITGRALSSGQWWEGL